MTKKYSEIDEYYQDDSAAWSEWFAEEETLDAYSELMAFEEEYWEYVNQLR